MGKTVVVDNATGCSFQDRVQQLYAILKFFKICIIDCRIHADAPITPTTVYTMTYGIILSSMYNKIS
jgi:hypothetical protein